MKRILLLLLMSGFIWQSHAQLAIVGSNPENLWELSTGTIIGSNKIKNNGSSPGALAWKVTAWSLPTSWESSFSFCDPEFCRIGGVMSAATSFDFTTGMEGAFKPQFTPPSAGSGSFEVTAWIVGDSAATATTCSYVIEFSGINDVKITPQVKTYPNPAKNTLVMEAENNTIKKIEIYDILGQKVKVEEYDGQPSEVKINITDLKEGMYIIQMVTTDDIRVSKSFKKLD